MSTPYYIIDIDNTKNTFPFPEELNEILVHSVVQDQDQSDGKPTPKFTLDATNAGDQKPNIETLLEGGGKVVLFTRHGQATHNIPQDSDDDSIKNGFLYIDSHSGEFVDAPLAAGEVEKTWTTARGFKLYTQLTKPNVFYSSCLWRALQTAIIFALVHKWEEWGTTFIIDVNGEAREQLGCGEMWSSDKYKARSLSFDESGPDSLQTKLKDLLQEVKKLAERDQKDDKYLGRLQEIQNTRLDRLFRINTENLDYLDPAEDRYYEKNKADGEKLLEIATRFRKLLARGFEESGDIIHIFGHNATWSKWMKTAFNSRVEMKIEPKTTFASLVKKCDQDLKEDWEAERRETRKKWGEDSRKYVEALVAQGNKAKVYERIRRLIYNDTESTLLGAKRETLVWKFGEECVSQVILLQDKITNAAAADKDSTI